MVSTTVIIPNESSMIYYYDIRNYSNFGSNCSPWKLHGFRELAYFIFFIILRRFLTSFFTRQKRASPRGSPGADTRRRLWEL